MRALERLRQENKLGNKNGFVGVRLQGDGKHINRGVRATSSRIRAPAMM